MKRLSLVISLCLATRLAAEPLACTDPLLNVIGGDKASRESTCTTASRVRKTLESCGVTLNRSIEIEIVEEFDVQYSACLGLYHCGKDQIEILSSKDMATARDRDGAFELISDDAYWQSIIAHELTHAAYDNVKCPFTSCVATAEYASYAMQVFSLPQDQQSLFGKTVKLRSKPSREAISGVMVFMSPDHFAKTAWLHFKAQDKPCNHMRQIMEGRVFFDQEPL